MSTTDAAPAPAPAAEAPWPRPAAAWYAVGILLLAYTFSFVDRTIMTILIEPIEHDLQINDTAISLLHGFAFVIFYVTLGLPLGALGDRKSRKWIICVSIALWSAMTAACGLAKTFPQLFAARVGVGIGEAGLSPATYSLIADYFPPERRAVPLGVYQTGIYLGAGLAILAGGALLAAVGRNPVLDVPLLGEVRSWQAVFFMAGIPGLFVAVLASTIREPARRGATRSDAEQGGTVRNAVTHLKAHRRVYLLHFVGFACVGTPFNVSLLWARPYLTRAFGVMPSDGAFAVGVLVLIFATSGIVIGSSVADRMHRAGHVDATVRTGLFAAIGLAPFVVAFPFMPTLITSLVALAGILFFGAFAIGAAPAALQLITPGPMRGLISALYLLVVNVMAQALGPVATGLLTDYVFRDPRSVGWSLSIVAVCATVVAVGSFSFIAAPFRRLALERSEPVVAADRS